MDDKTSLSGKDFSESIRLWLSNKSGREINRVAKREVEALGQSLSWTHSRLKLASKYRAKTHVELVLSYPAREDSEEANAFESARLVMDNHEIMSYKASGLHESGTWKSLQIRASTHTPVLEKLQSAVAPSLDLEDLLDLLLSLPWLRRTQLLSHVRTALLEDLLVDQCDKEDDGEDDETECVPPRKSFRITKPTVEGTKLGLDGLGLQ